MISFYFVIQNDKAAKNGCCLVSQLRQILSDYFIYSIMLNIWNANIFKPILVQYFISIPLENARKPLVFWRFSKYKNETLGLNGLTGVSLNEFSLNEFLIVESQ